MQSGGSSWCSPELVCEQWLPWWADFIQEQHVAQWVTLLGHHALQVPHSQAGIGQAVTGIAQALPQLVLAARAAHSTDKVSSRSTLGHQQVLALQLKVPH